MLIFNYQDTCLVFYSENRPSYSVSMHDADVKGLVIDKVALGNRTWKVRFCTGHRTSKVCQIASRTCQVWLTYRSVITFFESSNKNQTKRQLPSCLSPSSSSLPLLLKPAHPIPDPSLETRRRLLPPASSICATG